MNKKITTSLVASLLLSTNIYSNELSSITITSATKSEQLIKDVTASVSVITKEEIQERHFTTVAEALKTISGVSITSNGGVGQLDSLYIRGISSKRILVLIDGIRYNEPTGLSGAPLAQLLVDDIERIEVVKGAQSGIWGADASGGVVNIITTSAKEGFHGSALVEAGSFKTKKAALTLSNKTDKYFVKLNANKFQTDGFSAFEAKKGTPNYGKRGEELGLEADGSENVTLNFQAGVFLNDNNEINTTYKRIDAEYDYDSSTADDTTKKSELDHMFKSVNYIYTQNNYNVKLTASQSRFDRLQDTFVAKSLVNEFSILSNLKYGANSNLSVGLNRQNFQDSENDTKNNTKAVFISNNNRFNDLVLSEVLRYDNNGMFGDKITGKIGAKYFFTKDLNISSNIGTAYNAPTLGNLNYTPTLKPESSKSLDINVEYKGLKVTYFKTEVEDLIGYSFVPSFHYINEDGTSKLDGYELSYSTNIVEDTLFTLNYTRLYAKNSAGENLQRRAKDEIATSLDYYGISKTHLNLNASYTGKRYDSVNDTGAQTGKYALLNAVINYEISKDLTTYLKLDNITDKFYQTVDGYGTAGRSAYLGLKVSF